MQKHSVKFPYTTLFRSKVKEDVKAECEGQTEAGEYFLGVACGILHEEIVEEESRCGGDQPCRDHVASDKAGGNHVRGQIAPDCADEEAAEVEEC